MDDSRALTKAHAAGAGPCAARSPGLRELPARGLRAGPKEIQQSQRSITPKTGWYPKCWSVQMRLMVVMLTLEWELCSEDPVIFCYRIWCQGFIIPSGDAPQTVDSNP